MQRRFTLEYWIDDGWYVGKLKEVPGVFSQGEPLADLEENLERCLHADDPRRAFGYSFRKKD